MRGVEKVEAEKRSAELTRLMEASKALKWALV